MERAIFEDSMKNIEWLRKNYRRLKKEYDKKWVLICNQKIVDSKDTFDQILPTVRKYKSDSAILEFIQSEEVAMFF